MLALGNWRKSTRSQTATACIEVGQAPGHVGIRDTKDRAGGTLVVDRVAFGAFLTAVKADRLG
ncbi:DUF397 domain-containing protein [Actinoalloteichus hymeniacidonis]|uniref:DUF397 family protein n=1 Tax=Actinoalloteichus hymeniacidonis TaxID=340345 RepID=A0AAC9HTA4_9PSEU|nr:DUF397 domain-containing protein [Actinoalloteichus hymeniacidonis]AOS64085.1 putative DUF397 family protein [Actinoalloteichus hymeniacidonis]MBB5907852.1 hypothetical protein [Actinoalloteichus hymeniacidonis]